MIQLLRIQKGILFLLLLFFHFSGYANLESGSNITLVSSNSSSNSNLDFHAEYFWNTPVINNIGTNNPTDCDSNDGSIAVDASGDPPLEFSIDGGMTWQGFNTFLNLGAGNYAVQVRSGQICVPADEMIELVGPNSPMIVDVVTNDPAGCDIQNGVIVISATGGTGQFEYSINNGFSWQPQNTFQGLASGAYQVAIRNLDGTCFSSGGIITLNGSSDEPQIDDLFISGTTDCGVDDGIITIVLSNSSGNFEYSNDGGTTWQGGNSFTGLAGGVYDVLVRRTDMTCTVSVGNIEIETPSIAFIDNISSEDPTSCNLNDGSIIIESSPGIGFVEFSVDGGISWMPFNTFFGLAPGDYQPAIRNLDGSCLVEADMVTLQTSNQPSVNAVFLTNPTDCVAEDGQIIVTAIPCGLNEIEYSIDAGATWQPNGTFENLGGGNFEVLVRNIGETNTVSSGALELIAPPPPVIDDVVSTNLDCQGNGGTVTITASGNAGFLEYSINGVDWQPTGQFTALIADTYTPQVRFPNSNCITSDDPITLVQQPGLVVDEIQTAVPSCGQATGAITIIIVSSFDLEFSIDGGLTYQASNFFGGLSAGIFNPAVRIVGGDCETLEDPVVLDDNEAEIQNVTFVNPTDCGVNDGSITITATNVSGDLLYSINGGQSFEPTNQFVNLSPGMYSIIVSNGDGSCPVEYALNPLDLQAPAGGPIIDDLIVTAPSTCGAQDATLSILASGNPVIQYSIDGGQSFVFTNNFSNLSPGAYDIALQFPGSSCTTEVTIDIGANTACNDTINVTIPMEMTTELCLDTDVLQIVGTLTDASFCGQGNPNTVFAPIIDNNCISLAAAVNFSGVSPDTICTVHCYDNDPTLCDTTLIVVTVDNGMADCEDLLTITEITQDYSGNPTDVCIPLPILQAVNLNLVLNGNLYNNQLFGCLEDSVVVYSYAPLTGGGFNGPYNLNFWTVGGMMLNTTFTDANDLLAQMNLFDPSGMWEIDTDLSLLVSTNSDQMYGVMDITHIPTSNGSILQPNYTTIANGTVINVPNIGENELIIIDPNDGCADTLVINLVPTPVEVDTIFVETDLNVTIFDVCATGDDIPGGAQTLGLFQPPTNGGVILSGGLCVNYSPNIGYVGKDTFGLVACNNVGQTLCDSTVVVVCVNPPMDILTIDLDNTDPIDTCLTDLIQLPDGFTTAEICGINNDEVIAVLNGDCINIDPVDNFMGTTELCVVHCDDNAICDTTTIIVNVMVPCPDIFPITSLVIESDDDPVGVCVPVDSAILANLTLTLNGTTYNEPLAVCTDANGVMGTLISVGGGSNTYDLMVENPDNGCSDNLTIIIEEPPMPMLDTIFVTTPQDVPVDQICGNALDLPGNALNVGFCNLPSNGTAPVVNDSCVAYLPAPGFVGNDEFCLVICDDMVPTNCDSFLVVVSVLPPLDTVVIDAPGVSPFDTCLTAATLQLQDIIITTDTCGLDPDILDLTIDEECVTIDLADSFIGSTQACIIHCYDLVPEICDTTILVINNNNPPCPDIFLEEIITLSADTSGITDLCIEIPFDSLTNYNLLLNGAIYNGNLEGCNDDGDGNFLGTQIELDSIGNYTLFVEEIQSGCTDSIEISVVEGMNFIEITTFINTPSEVICLDTMDLIANFDSILICDFPINGMLLIEDNCFTYLPQSGYLGSDEAIIKLCDDQMNCDSFTLMITVIPLCNDFSFLINDTLIIETADCFEDGVSCLDIFPSDFVGNYNILDNGFPYDGGILPCNFDTCLVFNYFNLPGMGANGPYTVTSWDLNGTIFSGDFDNIEALVDSMNVWDDQVTWELEPANLSIRGCGITGDYGDIEITQIASGATATLDAVFDFIPEGTQISLGQGFHELVFIDINDGCTDTLLAAVSCVVDSTGCGNTLISDATQIVTNCDSLAEICVAIPIFDIDHFIVTIDGAPFVDPFSPCSSDPGSISLNLLPGDYELVFEDTVKACADTFSISINCLVIEDIVIDTLLGVDETLDLCLEDLGLTLSAIDSVENTCADQSTGNVDFVYDPDTGCITLFGEVEGVDTACYKVYLIDTCLTVFINVTVQSACDAGFFPQLNYGAGITDCSTGEAELCLPILPLEFENVIVTVGGVPYTDEFIPCDEELLLSYPYSSFPLGGIDPPYIIDSLLINDVFFTGVFDNENDFVDSLNTWDPGCDWEIMEEGSTISIVGGCMDNIYGPFSVTHQLTGISVGGPSPDTIFVPKGVAFNLAVGVGSQEIAFIDTVTMCTDTIVATLACIDVDTVFLDIELGLSDTFCLDTTQLVGNLVSIENACPDLSGEFVEIEISDAPCVIYTGIEPGEDLGCIVICDDLGVCDTTYLVITTTFDDGPPIANDDLAITGIDQVISINALCGNDENIDFLNLVGIVSQPTNGQVEIVVDSFATCLYTFNFVPDPGFCDDQPQEFVYEICNSLGCDTATVFVTINCEEITVFNGFSPNFDPNGIHEHFEIRGLNSIDYPGHNVKIFNRWGNRVFETNMYENNPWRGQWEGNDVPDGTYFYVIDLGNGQMLKGYVQVHR